MFFLIPIGTDAPLYHPPIATGVIIVLNILLFILQLTIGGFTEQWALLHGTINPLNCLISPYLHADFFHLTQQHAVPVHLRIDRGRKNRLVAIPARLQRLCLRRIHS